MRYFPGHLRTALALLAFALPASAATITVDRNKGQTIQGAIDGAADGDIILVTPGTAAVPAVYSENIDFKGKGITLTSTLSTDPVVAAAAAAVTIIDGGGLAPAVSFKTSEPRSASISGFTIRNGGGPDNNGSDFNYGGIYVSDAAPTIRNNTVTANNCWGILVTSAAPLIENNTVSATRTPAAGCGFTNGSAIFISGDLTADGSAAMVRGNLIEDNIESANSSTIQNGGAGIAVYFGSPTILNNTIRNNSAPFATGGGIDVIGGTDVVVAQNLIYGNQAGCGGGAIAFKTQSNTTNVLYLLVQNNTIVDNTGPTSALAAGCVADSQLDPTDGGYSSPIVVFLNNIISGSTSAVATDCYQQQTPSEYNQSIFDHNILSNAGGTFLGQYCIDVSGAYGNLASDPRFTNAATHDYHLQDSSPAIDAGNGSTVLFSTPFDFDGHARVQDATAKGHPIIDIGAYEVSGQTDATPTATVVSTSTPRAGRALVITAMVSSSSGIPPGTATFYIDRQISPGPLNPVTLDSTGTATFSVNLPIGPHSIYVVYSGSGTAFPPSVSVVTVVDVEPVKTSISIDATPRTALLGQNIVFTVTTSSEDPTYIPSPVTVYDTDHNNAVLATVTPDSTGTATFNDATLSGGLHTIVAIFAGNPSYAAASSSPLLVRVTSPTTLALASNTNPVQAFVSFTVTATVSNKEHNPSGTIQIFSDNALVASGTIIDPPNLPPPASGPPPPAPIETTISLSLPGGTHNLVAKYPGDDNSDAAVSNTVVETVLATPTAITISTTPNPALAFQTVVLTAKINASNSDIPPTGRLSFFANGKLISATPIDATGTATLPTSFPAGTYLLTASFAATESYGASTSAAVTEIVGKDPSMTSLSVAPNPGYSPGGTINLFTVVRPVLPTPVGDFDLPTGTITFYDGGKVVAIGNVTLLGDLPSASLKGLSPGDHILTAVYGGDSNYLPSTSGQVTLTILVSDFSLDTDPMFTIKTEQHKMLAFSLTSVGNFADTIGLACGNLPAFATCTFPMNGLALASGATVAATVRIDTDALFDYTSGLQRPTTDPNTTDSRNAIAFALLLPMALLANRRRGRSLRLFIPLVALVVATALIGCSGHQPGHTPPGSYNITITGTGATTHLTHTATISLIVTQ